MADGGAGELGKGRMNVITSFAVHAPVPESADIQGRLPFGCVMDGGSNCAATIHDASKSALPFLGLQ